MRPQFRHLRLVALIAILPLTANSGCGGAAEDTKQGTNNPDEVTTGCEWEGVWYDPGEEVPGASFDCNSCYCSEDGAISCTTAACGDGDISGGDGDGDGDISIDPPGPMCFIDGRVYSDGFAVPGGPCEACTCEEGAISCVPTPCPAIPACDQPFDAGPCEALIPVFWHNPETGLCEAKSYGGCDGNDNRFETLEDCLEVCDAEPAGPSCEVHGIVFSDGSRVPEPASCNSCTCTAGTLTSCTIAYCPTDCEVGTALGTDCSECGPTDECLTVRFSCLPTCTTQEDCDDGDGGLCIDEVCTNVCG